MRENYHGGKGHVYSTKKRKSNRKENISSMIEKNGSRICRIFIKQFSRSKKPEIVCKGVTEKLQGLNSFSQIRTSKLEFAKL